MNEAPDFKRNDMPDPGYDSSRYVSKAEYLRDVHALKNKHVKAIIFLATGFAIGTCNILLIRFTDVDHQFDWILVVSSTSSFAMDQIMAWLAVIFVLLIPGIWIGVATHRIYAFAYWGGFSIAGGTFMFIPAYFVPGLYAFIVSFFLLLLVYVIFYKIWLSFKRSVARARDA